MQKKKEVISGFKLLVLITFNTVNDPNKYAPLSPRNILALGKLNNKKINNTIIWAVIKIVKSCSIFLFKFIDNKIKFIIIKWIANKPLKPSIKFAPLIMNKKHNKTNIMFKTLNNLTPNFCRLYPTLDRTFANDWQ